MTSSSSDLFLLNGQSVLAVGPVQDTKLALLRVASSAKEVGYTVRSMDDWTGTEMRQRVVELSVLVEDRLRQNPEMVPYAGSDLRYYAMGAPHETYGYGMEARHELSRMMRLTLYSGVAFGTRARRPHSLYVGVRTVRIEEKGGFRAWQEEAPMESLGNGDATWT